MTLAGLVPRRPSLIFLSGCRTGQSLAAGAVPSLAEELLGLNFPAVLGWGRPVFDTDAIVAAAGLYDRLATGFTPVEAVLHAHARMQQAKSPDRRVRATRFSGAPCPCPDAAGESEPLAPAPALRRRRPPVRPGDRPEDPRATERGAGHARPTLPRQAAQPGRQGRRPPRLRRPAPPAPAVHPSSTRGGPVGRPGWSSTGWAGSASLRSRCRVCDRLADAFDPVVHVGLLDDRACSGRSTASPIRQGNSARRSRAGAIRSVSAYVPSSTCGPRPG